MHNYELAQKQAAQYAYAQGSANTAQSMVGAGVSSNRPPLVSEDITQRIVSRLASFENLTNRLGTVTDRISGAVPVDCAASHPTPPADSLVRKLQLIEEALGLLENTMRGNVERLEQFA